MKKQSYTVKSTKTCKICGQSLKANLIDKKPSADYCYKHYRKHVQGKPMEHVPRQKRINADLPVY